MGSIQIRGRTAALWASNNDVLLARQPGVESDTGQMKVGDGVTAWNELPYVGASAPTESGLTSGGAITIVSSTTIRVAASTYYIEGEGSFSATLTDFAGITLSSSGTQRYVGLYGNTSGAIQKVEGSEAALAAFPATPADTALIGYVLVTDGVVSTTPDLSGYLLKADKATRANAAAGTDDEKYLTSYAAQGIKRYLGYVHSHVTQFSPLDATYYYFGQANIDTSSSGLNTATNIREVGAPITGTIIAAIITVGIGNPTLATTETGGLFLRNTTTGTLHTISNTLTYNHPTRQKITVVTPLSIAVTQGDLCHSFIGNTTWATNPTNLSIHVQYIIQI